MAIRTVVSRGYGNGTYNGTIADAVTRGYTIGSVAVSDEVVGGTIGTGGAVTGGVPWGRNQPVVPEIPKVQVDARGIWPIVIATLWGKPTVEITEPVLGVALGVAWSPALQSLDVVTRGWADEVVTGPSDPTFEVVGRALTARARLTGYGGWRDTMAREADELRWLMDIGVLPRLPS